MTRADAISGVLTAIVGNAVRRHCVLRGGVVFEFEVGCLSRHLSPRFPADNPVSCATFFFKFTDR